jgi:uncharacterized ferritin-like protein (DUF455 family)
MKDGDSIVACAIEILHIPDPVAKAEATQRAFDFWTEGRLRTPFPGTVHHCPERPAQWEGVSLVSPAKAPKRGKGGSVASRHAMLHSLCHIECCAIDLAWDVIARFGGDAAYGMLPRQFFSDFVTVASGELCARVAVMARRIQPFQVLMMSWK